MSMTPQTFVDTYWPAAQQCEKDTGVPALITMAQAALESGWGNTVSGNAFFGIKADADWKAAGGAVVLQPTTECLPNGKRIHYDPKQHPEICSFRAYATPEEAFRDHALFLKRDRNYKTCWAYAQSDITGWAHALEACHYSTDRDEKTGELIYAQKLMDMVASVRKRLPRIG